MTSLTALLCAQRFGDHWFTEDEPGALAYHHYTSSSGFQGGSFTNMVGEVDLDLLRQRLTVRVTRGETYVEVGMQDERHSHAGEVERFALTIDRDRRLTLTRHSDAGDPQPHPLTQPRQLNRVELRALKDFGLRVGGDPRGPRCPKSLLTELRGVLAGQRDEGTPRHVVRAAKLLVAAEGSPDIELGVKYAAEHLSTWPKEALTLAPEFRQGDDPLLRAILPA